jgi:hypothetical protein
MKPYQNNDRFQANLRHFARRDRALAAVIERTRPGSRLVMDANGEFNLDLGGGAIYYPENARQAARQQVEGFLAAPSRIQCIPDEVFALCVELNVLVRDMRERMEPYPRAAGLAGFGGFVVVFGVGLGYHLKMLAEKLSFKRLIVVEMHDELLVHSMHVFDWQGFTRDLAGSGRELHIVRGPDLYLQILAILRGEHYPYLDGSYFFQHYQTPEFTAICHKFMLEGTDLAMAGGWIEDQLLMFCNNDRNFKRFPFHLRRRQVPTARRLPAFVVGAGPSLDGDIEIIRELRDQVVLISASSALRVLLTVGIRPDIHCEMENDPTLLDVIATHHRNHSLSDITLFASPTVHPDIPPHFERAIYYFRTQLGSSDFFGRDAESTPYGEPISGNTAIHCALSLGFRDVYLFGMDFGARDPKQHHSRHSAYFTYTDDSEMTTWVPYDFSDEVPANFGGTIQSGWILKWARNSASSAIRGVPSALVRNCSDGSLIPGAVPQDASELTLPAPAVSRRGDIEGALAGLDLCESEVVGAEEFAMLGGSFRSFLIASLDHLAAFKPAGRLPQVALCALCDPIIADLGRLKVVEEGAYKTMVGHVNEMLAGAHYYATRLDPAQADGALEAIRKCMTESLLRAFPLIAEALPAAGRAALGEAAAASSLAWALAADKAAASASAAVSVTA